MADADAANGLPAAFAGNFGGGEPAAAFAAAAAAAAAAVGGNAGNAAADAADAGQAPMDEGAGAGQQQEEDVDARLQALLRQRGETNALIETLMRMRDATASGRRIQEAEKAARDMVQVYARLTGDEREQLQRGEFRFDEELFAAFGPERNTPRTSGDQFSAGAGEGMLMASVLAYKPSKPGEKGPPGFGDSRLHDKSVSSYVSTMCDKSMWDESKSESRPEYAMQWFESKIEWANVANLDACALLRNHLSRPSQQWLKNLVGTNTYHHWSADNYAALRTEFRKRFAMQVRSDSVLAMERLVNKPLYQGEFSVEKYSEMFMHHMRLIGDGKLSAEMQCMNFLKGLKLDLKPTCLTDNAGEEWTDLHALIKHAEVQSRLLDAKHGKHAYKRPYTPSGAAADARKGHKGNNHAYPGASAAADARGQGGFRSDGGRGGGGFGRPPGGGQFGGGRGRGLPYGGGGGGGYSGGRGGGGYNGGGFQGGGSGSGQRWPAPTKSQLPAKDCPEFLATNEPLNGPQKDILRDWGICFACRGHAEKGGPAQDGGRHPIGNCWKNKQQGGSRRF